MARPPPGHPPITPTVPPAIHLLATPPPTLIDAQLPAYLLPAALELLRDAARAQVRKRRAEEDALRQDGLVPPRHGGQRDDEVAVAEELAKRVERIGLMVGGYVAEKLTLARPPLGSHLDIIKFICKDLFLHVYAKQIDNLRTNHRGVYVLQSQLFPPLLALSSARGQASDMEDAKTHLLFPQAFIQGALARLGMHAQVSAESSGLAQCTFQIRTVKTNVPATPLVGGTPDLHVQPQRHSAPPPPPTLAASTAGSAAMSVTASASSIPGAGARGA